MKEMNKHFVLFGALFTASLALVRCGGDDSTPSGTAGTAGSATGGSSGGAGSSGGTAGSSAGAGGTAGATAGAGGGTAGGAGTTDAGSNDAPVTTEAGACPAMPPAEDSVCTMRQVCHYPNSDCACTKTGGGADAGRSWTCASNEGGVVSDAGTPEAGEAGTPEAGACPAAVMDGDACTTRGQRCPFGDAGLTCVCLRDVFNCP
jgi:hypothetical protein